MNGKGDSPRPYNPRRFGRNYDAINWHRPLLEEVRVRTMGKREPYKPLSIQRIAKQLYRLVRARKKHHERTPKKDRRRH